MKKYGIFEKTICEKDKSCCIKALGFREMSSYSEPLLNVTLKKEGCRSLSLGWV